MTTYRTPWRSSAARISAGWKLVSPTRGQTLDGSRRCDEGDPARESLQTLVGRESQAFLDEGHVVVQRVLDLSTQRVLDRGLVVGGILSHGGSILQADRRSLPKPYASAGAGAETKERSEERRVGKECRL